MAEIIVCDGVWEPRNGAAGQQNQAGNQDCVASPGGPDVTITYMEVDSLGGSGSFPSLTIAEGEEILGAILLLWAIAYGARVVIRTFTKKG